MTDFRVEKGASIGGASSVTASDSSLTISPTTGAVLAGLNVNNPNLWTALQSFNASMFGLAGAIGGTKRLTVASNTGGNWLIPGSGSDVFVGRTDTATISGKTLTDPILGSDTGTTNEGAIWDDSTQKSISSYVNGVKQSIIGCIFTGTADATVTNTVAETSVIPTGVGTMTIPANFLVVGKAIRIRIGGIYSTPIASTPSVIVKIKYGSTILASVTTSGLLAGASSLEFDGEACFTCRSVGATGTIAIHGDIEYSTGVAGTISVDSLNNGGATKIIDTTTSNLIDITVAWDSATTTRIIKTTSVIVEVLN